MRAYCHRENKVCSFSRVILDGTKAVIVIPVDGFRYQRLDLVCAPMYVCKHRKKKHCFRGVDGNIFEFRSTVKCYDKESYTLHRINQCPDRMITNRYTICPLKLCLQRSVNSKCRFTSIKTFNCSQFSDEIYKLLSHVYGIVKDYQLMKQERNHERFAELLNVTGYAARKAILMYNSPSEVSKKKKRGPRFKKLLSG
ncbi:hypothetical protein EDC96DRAFT_583229 [Choanephora cucurbitarum]|nr:hypothetical protein EDC96DRAFT_583229 [Choanephora cucurbitarum]